MDVDLDEFRVHFDGQLIADGLEERLEGGRVLFGGGVSHDQQLDTVDVLERTGGQRFAGSGGDSGPFGLACRGGGRFTALDILLFLGLRVRGVRDDGTVLEHGLHAFEDEEQALSAGVHDTGLLQDRQQFRCLSQCIARAFDDVGEDLVKGRFFMFGPVPGTGLGRQTDDRQNGTFGGGHDGFVCGLDAVGQREDHIFRIDLFLALEAFGDAPEDEGQDDAGVSAGTPQHGGGGGLRDLVHGDIVRETLQLLAGRSDRHRHIGSRIAVRHREHVERVDRISLVRDIIGRRDHGVPKYCSVDQNFRTLLTKSWNRRTRRPS